MKLPTWLNLWDLFLHVAGGALLTAALTALGTPWLGCLLSALAVGCAHEQAELLAYGSHWGDFRAPTPGAPLNGIVDVLGFLGGAAIYLLAATLR